MPNVSLYALVGASMWQNVLQETGAVGALRTGNRVLWHVRKKLGSRRRQVGSVCLRTADPTDKWGPWTPGLQAPPYSVTFCFFLSFQERQITNKTNR